MTLGETTVRILSVPDDSSCDDNMPNDISNHFYREKLVGITLV